MLFFTMFKKLPIGHQRIKGCVNPRKNQEDYEHPDISNWDELDDGSMCIVFASIPYEDEDYDMWDRIKELNNDACYRALTTSGLLPMRVQNWMNEKMVGDWMYQSVDQLKGRQYSVIFKLFFQKKEDAVMFRLRWENE